MGSAIGTYPVLRCLNVAILTPGPALFIVGVIMAILTTEYGTIHAGGRDVMEIITITHGRLGMLVNSAVNVALILCESPQDPCCSKIE